METATIEIVKIDPAEFGLESSRAKEISDLFQPMLDKMVELEIEYNQIQKLEISETKCKVAKELRLRYVKVRTGTAKIHKSSKAGYLAGCKFIDGWKNAQLMASEEIEKNLKATEDHYFNLRKAEIEKLQEERAKSLADTDIDPIPENLGEMAGDVWENFITGARAARKSRLEAEEKAEAERLEAEEKERAEQARIKEENKKLKKEAEEAEEKRRQEVVAETRRRTDELAKQNELLKERDKAKAELKAKEEAEEAANQKEIEEVYAAKQVELAKGDGGKMTDLSIDLKMLKEKYEFESDDYKHLYMRVGAFIDRLRNEIEDARDEINSK